MTYSEKVQEKREREKSIYTKPVTIFYLSHNPPSSPTPLTPVLFMLYTIVRYEILGEQGSCCGRARGGGRGGERNLFLVSDIKDLYFYIYHSTAVKYVTARARMI